MPTTLTFSQRLPFLLIFDQSPGEGKPNHDIEVIRRWDIEDCDTEEFRDIVLATHLQHELYGVLNRARTPVMVSQQSDLSALVSGVGPDGFCCTSTRGYIWFRRRARDLLDFATRGDLVRGGHHATFMDLAGVQGPRVIVDSHVQSGEAWEPVWVLPRQLGNIDVRTTHTETTSRIRIRVWLLPDVEIKSYKVSFEG